MTSNQARSSFGDFARAANDPSRLRVCKTGFLIVENLLRVDRRGVGSIETQDPNSAVDLPVPDRMHVQWR
ncbi:hypothetical protein IE4872_PD00465 (plasmid) [Rhizobium gallicum]|uniref:Uncharacterized protein n=1 Tax=Rhizobium gallicum TaxID=56730 RepID=A0A1L5NSW9_9HYPH|nr:hypothetical protein [Rhizobium gallicum]APO70997.1 hypothetical protein IE4872_PD00465 [Rhizobium gallicum]